MTHSSAEILIVEDSQAEAELLKSLLERKGHRVSIAADGRQALHALEQRQPALIITEIETPAMDGYALCQAIKQDSRLKEIPVILLTSLSDSAAVLRGLEARADSYITKPFDNELLLSRIEWVLSQPSPSEAESPDEPLEIVIEGKRRLVTAPRRQILNLLVSTYMNAVDQSRELAKVQNELALATEEFKAFSYSVSHDLRAPLRRIDGFGSILLEEEQKRFSTKGKEHLNCIINGARQMNQLLEALVALARVSYTEMVREKVDLTGLAQSLCTDIQRLQPDRKVEWVIAPDVVADGDANLLQSALDNLLRNAWKFTSKLPSARVEFGARQDNGTQVYFVRDNGAGFNMEYAHKLFGVFQRLHGVTEFPGAGVGLAMAQRIFRRHGGKIWAEAAVDQGATFYFTLG